jgi:hypothetical protein
MLGFPAKGVISASTKSAPSDNAESLTEKAERRS